MLNNNIKILLVSFVHHIELQNFLNAPRMYVLDIDNPNNIFPNKILRHTRVRWAMLNFDASFV